MWVVMYRNRSNFKGMDMFLKQGWRLMTPQSIPENFDVSTLVTASIDEAYAFSSSDEAHDASRLFPALDIAHETAIVVPISEKTQVIRRRRVIPTPSEFWKAELEGRDGQEYDERETAAEQQADHEPLAVAVADLFDVPMRFSSAVWDAMDKATRQQLICDIVSAGRK